VPLWGEVRVTRFPAWERDADALDVRDDDDTVFCACVFLCPVVCVCLRRTEDCVRAEDCL
jgi:hypothetical protein